MNDNLETIILAGGCFWCTEAIFLRLKGVKTVVSGYSGGERKNPTYQDVSSGTTGHAECIKIEFDPKTISLDKILEVFFNLHDPTTLNRQGADEGTQYRSAIFYMDEAQKTVIDGAIKKAQEYYKDKIVTEVSKFKNFYKAENYHQKYYDSNKGAMYCNLVITPKIKKLLDIYGDMVKN